MQHVLLACEIGVQRAAAIAGRLGQIVNGGLGVSLFGEEAFGSLHDLFAVEGGNGVLFVGSSRKVME